MKYAKTKLIDPLKDKRDENFIQLKSNTYFFEIFKKKKYKSDIIIPHSIIFESGNPTNWFFNSKNHKTPLILTKNTEKLNLLEICKFLIHPPIPKEYRIDNLSSLTDYCKKNQSHVPVCFIRYIDKKTEIINSRDLVKLFVDGKQGSSVSVIQQYLNHNIADVDNILDPKSNEVFYVEYRHDENTVPLNFKFYKKSIIIKKSKNQTPLQLQKKYNEEETTKKETNKQIANITYFRSFNQGLNNKLTEVNQNIYIQIFLLIFLIKITLKLVEFIEKSYKLKIRKFVPKYLVNINNEPFFIGIKYFYIEVYSYAPYDFEVIKESKDMDFNEFYKITKQTKRPCPIKVNGLQVELPKQIHQDDKTYSSILYKKMRIEKCGGDFCNYEMLEKNNGPLAMQMFSIEDQKKKIQLNQTKNIDNISISLPYEISNQLVLKTRQNSSEVISILLKNKIFQSDSSIVKQKYEYQNDENFKNIDESTEYPFKNKNKQADNYENLYKRIKICKQCFVIYSLVTKHFEKQQKQIQKESIMSSKSQTYFQTQKQFKIGITHKPNRVCSKISKNPSVYKDSEIETQHKMILTQYIPSQKYKLLINSRKDIETNRLTLGFYIIIYSFQTKKQKIDSQMRKALQNKLEQHINLQQNPYLIQTASLYYNHTNFQHLRQLSKFKVNFLKNKIKNMYMFVVVVGYLYNKYQIYYINNIQIQFLIYKLSSPIKPFYDELDISFLPSITLDQVCNQMGYEMPSQQNTQDMSFLIIDESTAIPYCLLQENITNENQNTNNIKVANQQSKLAGDQDEEENKQKSYDIIVFLHDFFDSFVEYRHIFQQIISLNQNTKVLLLNLPGQAYTIFNQDLIYTNIFQLEVIDKLIFKLNEEKLISTQYDKFKFIGFGYGGFILQSYMVCCYGNLPNLNSLLLINSFAEVDNILKDTLTKSLEIFESCPEDMNDLAFNYFSVIVNSNALTDEQLKNKMENNPILNQGRITIIKGILQSYIMKDRFEKVAIPCFIVHSLKNCVVNINQSEFLLKSKKDENQNFQANLMMKKLNEKKSIRKIKYVNGGHSMLEQRTQKNMSQILISSPFCQTFSFSIKSPTTPLEILFSHLKDLKTKILEHLDTNNLFFTLNNKPILGTLVLNNQNNLQNLKIFPKLNGGKGGFGSQMKKEAMSQKKITNWDASRSLDGRRIRDINNEKNLIKFYKKQKQEQEKIDKELEEYKEMQKINGEKNFGYVVKNDYKEKCEKEMLILKMNS
ncbi:hypothetical protein IMG5_143970 [Ichthyophthirius multifiliis]|uniref:SDE2-like domain-containing protein n=1 Tax=Ichthyophthirius multifiliis TaxID=5932 RepID=G0QXM2_ICHMU|nr:hypothetical protein IMG5_143970 [Ichthyophthirius multifiliis]EGR30022.1 hypothetical protein IMG5_143970 [Ichthyophthirius multifiliis]|eukprot:XP_004031258.1 hypothetical protein IMG5_143970 [Ichthyophthirius multifiliis]